MSLKRRAFYCLAFFVVAAGLPVSASASYYNVYGLGSRAVAMGGAYAALANDAVAVYYNPAALVEAGPYRTEMGVSRNFYNLKVSVAGDYWTKKLSELGFNSTKDIEALFQDDLKEVLYMNIGTAMALWKDAAKKPLFSMGFLLNAPLKPWFNRFFFQDPNDPIFLEYTNYPNKFSILFGTGFNVSGILKKVFDVEIPGISLGVGANTFFLGVGTLEMMPSYTAIKLPWDFAPIAGILIKPFEDFDDNRLKSLKLGVSYNGGMNLVFNFKQMSLMGMTGRMTAPDSYSIGLWRLGVGFDPVENLTVGYELDRVLWSEYRPPFWTAEGSVKGLLAQDFEFTPFNDIWVNRIGVEYRLFNSSLNLRGGYFFRPSAVPSQSGDTNFIDCNTHVVSLGVSYRVLEKLTVATFAQNRIMPKRTMEKIGSDPALTGTIAGSGSGWYTGLELIVEVREP
ncbi:MAG: outer membrane protein transport protein [Proteobacteria bacterium]|nr:outer membrane protein transport protein [Pseudomonadota bacterium]